MNDCVPLGGSMCTVHLLLEYSCLELVVYEGSRIDEEESRSRPESPTSLSFETFFTNPNP